MICIDTTSVYGGIKLKSQELTFLIFKKVVFFVLKFYIVPTLCDIILFNNYVGQTLQFNLMNLAFMPGSAVLLFYRILKRGSVDFCVLSIEYEMPITALGFITENPVQCLIY